jgi:prepilin-type N-terminal cleavage/methylation domain-containing protein
MRRAVTFIELIFVMVILGILTGLGFGFTKSDTTYRDGEAVLLKLKEARYKAMGYEGLLPDFSDCVELNQNGLNDPLNQAGGYQLKSTISLPWTDGEEWLCFDNLGRPHKGQDSGLDSLLGAPMEIDLYHGDKNCTIVVFQQSGYAIIACNK